VVIAVILPEPMHLHMDYMTHLNEEAAKRLAEISEVDKSGWAERLCKELITKAEVIKMLENSK
jgi:hypothetical protein